MANNTTALRDDFLARLAAKAPEGWEILRDEILALGDVAFRDPGEAGSLARFLSVESDRGARVPSVGGVHFAWAQGRQAAAAREEAARVAASTYEVVYWRGATLAKKRERIAREERDRPWQDGCVVVSEGVRLDGGRGHDSDFGPTFQIVSHPVGHEMVEGTVRGKRLLSVPGQGRVVQYLVRPRSAKAETAYQTSRRLAEIDRQLADVEMLDRGTVEALHAEREKITRGR